MDGTKEAKAIQFPYQEEHASKGNGEGDSEVLCSRQGSQEGGLTGDVRQWEKHQARTWETGCRLRFLHPLGSSLPCFSCTEAGDTGEWAPDWLRKGQSLGPGLSVG